jgi:hypothetical protein
MFIGLCLITSTIHGNLRNTLAISTSLSFKIAHFFTHSTPNVCNSRYSFRSSSAGRAEEVRSPLHFTFVLLQNLPDALLRRAALRLVKLYAVYDGAAVDVDFIADANLLLHASVPHPDVVFPRQLPQGVSHLLLDATARLFANEARHETVYDYATTPIYAAYVAGLHGDYGTPPALQPPLDVQEQSRQILLFRLIPSSSQRPSLCWL